MSQLDYTIYTVPDPEEYTIALAERMLSVTNPAKLVKEANANTVVEDYDIKDLHRMLNDLSYENCKIVLMGNNILEREELDEQLGNPLSKIKKEKWMSVKYRVY